MKHMNSKKVRGCLYSIRNILLSNEYQSIFIGFSNSHTCYFCHLFILIIWKWVLKLKTIQSFNLSKCHTLPLLLPNINISFLQGQSLWLIDCWPPCEFQWKLYFNYTFQLLVWWIDSSHGTPTYLSNLTKSYVGGYGGNVPGLYTICSTTPRAPLVSPASVPIF